MTTATRRFASSSVKDRVPQGEVPVPEGRAGTVAQELPSLHLDLPGRLHAKRELRPYGGRDRRGGHGDFEADPENAGARQRVGDSSRASSGRRKQPSLAIDLFRTPMFSFAGYRGELSRSRGADAIGAELAERGISVFNDRYEMADPWGKNLYEHLSAVYREKARYCLMFLSENYAKKAWTSHERRDAQARAFRENREYILPIRLDDTQVEGIQPTTSYIDAREYSPQEIAQMVLSK